MPHADQPAFPTPPPALAQLAGLPLRGTSIRSLLQTAADLTTQALPGDIEASVTLLGRHRTTTVVSTGRLAADLDAAQYAAGEGPCLHAAATGEPTVVTDTRSDTRWARFMQHARAQHTLSSLSLPLAVSADATGSLNIYAQQVDAFTEHAQATATSLAARTATAVGNVRDYQAIRARSRRMRAALELDAVTDHATGMLIERQAISATDAHHVLTETARQTGITVREVAAVLVGTGELPDPRHP